MSDLGPEDINENSSAVLPLELLAPAGDAESLTAAIEAGADAIYLGLRALNARRRAANFGQEQLLEAIEQAHRKGVKVYLTLNTEISQRELGQAARALELASQGGVDAVLVRDPALLWLHEYYPALPFHFSTQNCVTNSADVSAARRLGATRVVLAREMSLEEISAASAVPGIETEVFVQGALCFSVSGRCLLSSWVGGRSGNRGACTSPCRVPWSAGGEPVDTPLSMRDLAAVHRLGELSAAGVRALKIEGRMKTAEWVAQSVDIYRRARDAGDSVDADALLEEARGLGAYTGREMTCGYLDEQRDQLTGRSRGRGAGTGDVDAAELGEAGTAQESDDEIEHTTSPLADGDVAAHQLNSGQHCEDDEEFDDAEGAVEDLTSQRRGPTYDLDIRVDERGIVFTVVCAGQKSEWTMPRTVVRRPEKAVALANMVELLQLERFEGHRLRNVSAEPPDYLLVPRAFNEAMRRIGTAVRQATKGPSSVLRLALPPQVQEALAKTDPHGLNKSKLGDRPDRVRLDAAEFGRFVREVENVEMIVVGVTAENFKRIHKAAVGLPFLVALPTVFFEDDIVGLRRLLSLCRQARVPVEVNGYGSWLLAREARIRMEGGPGMPVLNTLAAQKLTAMGLRSVMVSVEADRKQIEDLCDSSTALLSLTVFGRPPLMTSRVQLPRSEFEGRALVDRRGTRMISRREHGLWVFRPEEAFDLRNLTNERVHVRHLVVDLTGSPDPLDDWRDVPLPDWTRFRFNYDRTLA